MNQNLEINLLLHIFTNEMEEGMSQIREKYLSTTEARSLFKSSCLCNLASVQKQNQQENNMSSSYSLLPSLHVQALHYKQA